MDWLNTQTGEIIDFRHPDHQFWSETFAHENALDAGWDAADGQAPPVPSTPGTVEVPSVALVLSRDEAAAVLRCSPQHFDRHHRPKLREMQSGRLIRYSVVELAEYVNANLRRAL